MDGSDFGRFSFCVLRQGRVGNREVSVGGIIQTERFEGGTTLSGRNVNPAKNSHISKKHP